MNERTEAILETAKPFVFGLGGALATLALIHFLGIEWFCALLLIGVFGYLVKMLYRENLERIRTLRRIRNDRLIDTIKTSDQ